MTTQNNIKADLTDSLIQPDFAKDGQRRFTYQPKMDGELEEGDTVRITMTGAGEVLFTIESFGKEFGEGARYAYGTVDFAPAIEAFSKQLGGRELTADMEKAARAQLGEHLTTEEQDAIIAGLK